jgi:tRNA-splicing ligase RtcB (3'-phosphate/5'-hydroxy nucleic acid ligase)
MKAERMQSNEITRNNLISLGKALYEIPRTFRSDMRVPARVFLNEQLLQAALSDRSLWQLVNTTTLPGIQRYAYAMPDIHEGYGFPIGGVVATAIDQGGVISPGGIGYDINCGVRLLSTNITSDALAPYLAELATKLFTTIPSGVGRSSTTMLSAKELETILAQGAHALAKQGIGNISDLEHCEEEGCMKEANPDMVSDKAKKRGHDQLGTLGSGNHFLEIQKIDTLYEENTARLFGLQKNMVTIMIHCGSRGLGHQTCTDYVRTMIPKLSQWGIDLPDRELACAPCTTKEGQDYFAAMAASANFAWANRHLIGHQVRETFVSLLGPDSLVRTVYDVSHNIGKKETHTLNGKPRELMVHRKGATRAFPAGRPEIPPAYASVGHPVLIPGTMGTASYVLVGQQAGMEAAFGSCCHGAGRRMSRMEAKKSIQGALLRQELEARGIIIRCDSNVGLAEEAPTSYKNVDVVMEVVEEAQLARRVARLTPLAVIKGG